jgi:hypothetical protein
MYQNKYLKYKIKYSNLKQMTGGMEFDDDKVLISISNYSDIELYDKIIHTISIIEEVPDKFEKRMDEKIKEYTSWDDGPLGKLNALSDVESSFLIL